MDRQLIGYLLIVLVVAAVAAMIVFQLYHSSERTYRRQLRKDRLRHRCRTAEQEG